MTSATCLKYEWDLNHCRLSFCHRQYKARRFWSRSLKIRGRPWHYLRWAIIPSISYSRYHRRSRDVIYVPTISKIKCSIHLALSRLVNNSHRLAMSSFINCFRTVHFHYFNVCWRHLTLPLYTVTHDFWHVNVRSRSDQAA